MPSRNSDSIFIPILKSLPYRRVKVFVKKENKQEIILSREICWYSLHLSYEVKDLPTLKFRKEFDDVVQVYKHPSFHSIENKAKRKTKSKWIA